MTQYKYLRGSQDSREAVEFDIAGRGQYITTCVDPKGGEAAWLMYTR